MVKQTILKTNFRLFGIFMSLFSAGVLSINLVFDKELPWVLMVIFALMFIWGLRNIFKDTTHEIFLENDRLNWNNNTIKSGYVDVNELTGIEIRSYWKRTSKNKSLEKKVILHKHDGFEEAIPENFYINTSLAKLETALSGITLKYPLIHIDTKEVERDTGYKKYINWNDDLAGEEWQVRLEPNKASHHSDCEVEIDFQLNNDIQFEVEIEHQDLETIGPYQIIVDERILATFDTKREGRVKNDINLKQVEVKDYIQSGKILTVRSTDGYEWKGPILYYR